MVLSRTSLVLLDIFPSAPGISRLYRLSLEFQVRLEKEAVGSIISDRYESRRKREGNRTHPVSKAISR